jgi:tRNA dimethylallyltransferase
MNQSSESIICLMGPTASGKSAAAMKIASQFPVEIISVDSALVYQGMNIGTAKPTKQELSRVPHHLIDIVDPAKPFSAGEFCQLAKQLIEEIIKRKKVPLLVGGTMLYFHALINGSAALPEASEDMRALIENEAGEKGWGAIHQQLKVFDPEAYKRINPNDSQRIQRAVEVYRLTGTSITDLQKHTTAALPYQVVSAMIQPRERKNLHSRIEKRLHSMFEAGFVDEVKSLYARGDLHLDLPSMRSVGYRQVWSFLDGDMHEDELFDKVLFATRQLAKRQLTWLRRRPCMRNFYMEDLDGDDQIVEWLKEQVFL